MKYYLEESIKHILSERFILNEAEGDETATDAFDTTIYDKITSLRTKASNYIKHHDLKEKDKNNADTVSNLRTAAVVLNSQMRRTKDVNEIKADAVAAIEKIEKLLQLADASFNATDGPLHQTIKDKPKGVVESTAYELFNTLKTLARSSAVDRKTIDKLKQYVGLFTAAISDLNVNDIKNKIDTSATVTACENLILSLDNLSDFYKSTSKTGEAFTTINKQIQTATDIHDTWVENKTTENLTKMTSAFESLNSNIIKVLNAEGVETDASKERSMHAIDWAKRYKEAVDKNQFWENYYKQVWGTNAGRIIALGDAFKLECLNLGFSATTNPFISFIQKYIVGKKYSIDKAPYDVLHNAIANSRLKAGNLTTEKNYANLIYCRDFYTKDAATMKEYIDRLGEINGLDLADIFDKDKIDKIVEPERKEKFKSLLTYFEPTTSHTPFVWAILFDTVKFSELIKADGEIGSKSNVLNVPTSIDAVETVKLRAIPEIKALLQILKPELMEARNKAYDNNTLQQLVNKIPANKDDVGKWISVLISTFLLPVDMDSLYEKFPDLKNVTLTAGEIAEIKKEALALGNSMTPKQIRNILVAFERAAGNIRFRPEEEAARERAADEAA